MTQADPSGTLTYTWDARNRLAALSGPSLTASLAYDGLGRRAQKTVNGVLTQFRYDGLDAVLESSGGNDVTYLRTLGLDETLARTDAVETVHYLAEALGSSVALANPAGGVATTYTYEPFGRTETTGTPNPNPYRFTGREDDGTGLYYYRARYYDPGRERFVSEDPIGLAGGLNPYAYVGANPLSFADPLGLWRWPGQVYNDAMVDAMGRFPLNTMHNGPGDAYRHCLASCIMTRENSETEATFLGWLNEVRGDWTHNQERGERQMDEYNNEAGRMCGRTATSTQDCRDRCLRTTLIQSYQGGSTPPYSQTGYYGNLR